MTTDTPKANAAFIGRPLKGIQAEATYAGALSFMRRRMTRDLSQADIVVFGVPFDHATTHRPGARFGPRAIREQSACLAWNRIHGFEPDPLETCAVIDAGDLILDSSRPDLIPEAITSQARALGRQGGTLLALGGDHFCSYPLLQATAAIHGPLALLQFDAHSDTWPDSGAPSLDHGTMFTRALHDQILIPKACVQVGLRTHNPESHGITPLYAETLHAHQAMETAAQIRSILGAHPVYLTLDIDCLDPAFAPGTGTPVPGGLSTAHLLAILRALNGINLVGMDVVEVAPAYDCAGITALAAAALAQMLLALAAVARSQNRHHKGT